MILTVTLNAALDLTYRVPRLRPHSSHRVVQVAERAGGKGLNVACVLAELGHDVTVTGFAGGVNGQSLRTLLAGAARGRAGVLADALVPVAGNTRRTVGVVDTATGDATQFNEPGPEVSAAEWAEFTDRYAQLLDGARAVALCGSLPPGVPVGAYAPLVRTARARGVPVLLDTGGEPLRRGIAARPDVVKPNAAELAELTGSTDPLRAALDARRRGAYAVVASLGPEGMLAVTPDGSWRAAAPERLSGNPTGAGDAVVAALLSGWVRGVPWPERLAQAVALSGATVRAGTAGEFDGATYEALLPRVKVTPA
ncbi:1-phosphofructokinase family hexose kinase [Streptomyces sp. NPDC052396]|uniref:1-phosphofructokinase family hexose kinase n=1 Tax=Streptomyces sp. NPDC052396 TaxID=3365689 RepID=UPI0037D7BA79